ncbi:hypothetical protein ACEWK1_07160 [Metabacillus sp. YM-086]
MKTTVAVNLLGNGHHESNEDQRAEILLGNGHHESNEDQCGSKFTWKWPS